MLRGRIRGVEHCCFHITHRCQERRFLLKFEIDRRNYVKRLREASLKYQVDILDYIVTSNHIHLLLWTADADSVSAMMQYVQGTTGRDFNRRKRREGAFWRDRYNPTLIQNGDHLSRCLFYIDLNMVRAGVVEHPAEWRCCGYHELSGRRQRYRIANKERLLRCLGVPCSVEEFDQWYQTTLADRLASGYHVRESLWSECVAVGDEDWITDLAGRVKGIRQELVRYEFPDELGEDKVSYGLKVGQQYRRGLAADLAG
jgi:REP element-mobilizing transposase RayT